LSLKTVDYVRWFQTLLGRGLAGQSNRGLSRAEGSIEILRDTPRHLGQPTVLRYKKPKLSVAEVDEREERHI